MAQWQRKWTKGHNSYAPNMKWTRTTNEPFQQTLSLKQIKTVMLVAKTPCLYQLWFGHQKPKWLIVIFDRTDYAHQHDCLYIISSRLDHSNNKNKMASVAAILDDLIKMKKNWPVPLVQFGDDLTNTYELFDLHRLGPYNSSFRSKGRYTRDDHGPRIARK